MQGKDLSSDISISTTQLGSSASMLSIESVDYTHSGTFTCKVSNEAGYVAHTTELKVNGIPQQQGHRKKSIQRFWFYVVFRHCPDNIWRLSRGVMVMGNIFENVNNDLLLRSDCFLQNSPRLRSQ